MATLPLNPHRLPTTRHRHPHPEALWDRRQHWIGKWIRLILMWVGWGSKQECALAWWTQTSEWMLLLYRRLITYVEDCRVLEDDFVVFSAFGSCWSAGVSRLAGRCLNAIISLVFADDGSRLVVTDVAVKCFEFRVVTVYTPNIVGKRRSFFHSWLRSLTTRILEVNYLLSRDTGLPGPAGKPN